MDADARAELESRVQALCTQGNLDGGLAAAITGYGPELFGFLLGLAHDRTRADDLFAVTCEKMWRGLAEFEWRSSFRVWAYQIARNEFLRSLREVVRARNEVPLSQVESVQLAVERVRTATAPHEQSAVKDRFAALRAELAPEDHMLLGLRIDRKMGWTEIATILGAGEAALRKRFERLKAKLRERALE